MLQGEEEQNDMNDDEEKDERYENFEGEETKGHYVVFPRLRWMDEVTLPRSFRLTFTWRAECHRMTKQKISAHDFVHGLVQYGNFRFAMDDSEYLGRRKLDSK
ncbi:hypothetical protein PG991_000518 [Apiospora marii]|uniref:Uncharacterized protein n=1 Tax=Apiospora marii TaxID=335849 RepID=A0ABR1T445_9PEZI